MVLTPDGRISRYFYGVEYPGRDMRLGLVDASAGKIGTPIDHVLLFCYQYDPTSATYSASILKIVRLAGVLTIAMIVGGILIFRRRTDIKSPPAAARQTAVMTNEEPTKRAVANAIVPEQASNFAPRWTR